MSHFLSINRVISTNNKARLLEKTLTGIMELKGSANTRWKVLVVENNCTDIITPELKRLVREKDWLIFEIFPEFDI